MSECRVVWMRGLFLAILANREMYRTCTFIAELGRLVKLVAMF